MTRGDLLGDETAGHAAHREVEKQELSQRLTEALDSLDPRERKILQMRFGLERGAPRSTMGAIRRVVNELATFVEAGTVRWPRGA